MICLRVEYYDSAIKRYVKTTGVPFLVIEYRLAPEFKAPIQVTDTYAELEYLVSHAKELGIDPHRIALVGDSGGGAIAASLAHYITRNKGPPVCKQILIYPMLDDRTTTTPENIAPFASWDGDVNKTAWTAVLGEDRVGGGDIQPTEAAARMTIEDAQGLPPAYIDVGELDLFRDESLEYARKLGRQASAAHCIYFRTCRMGMMPLRRGRRSRNGRLKKGIGLLEVFERDSNARVAFRPFHDKVTTVYITRS